MLIEHSFHYKIGVKCLLLSLRDSQIPPMDSSQSLSPCSRPILSRVRVSSPATPVTTRFRTLRDLFPRPGVHRRPPQPPDEGDPCPRVVLWKNFLVPRLFARVPTLPWTDQWGNGRAPRRQPSEEAGRTVWDHEGSSRSVREEFTVPELTVPTPPPHLPLTSLLGRKDRRSR